jgi:tRNA(Arg) A34 adenosine deaminase TadA/RimJ/RimL family protein N-acetyltransferase
MALNSAPGVFTTSYDEAAARSADAWQSTIHGPANQAFGLFDGQGLIGITAVFAAKDDPSGETASFVMSFILPDYRGRGLSRLLYAARLEWVAARPRFTRVVMSFRESNAASQRAARRFGFANTGRAARTWPDGGVENEVFFELRLPNGEPVNGGGSKQTPMARAFAEAEAARDRGEAPIGAVVVDGRTGEILAAAGNRTEADSDPTAHAELLAIRAAAKARGEPRLPDCDLYVTLEPCALCAAAISFARLRRVYFGAYDPKGGAVEHGPRWFGQPTCHHRPEIYGGIDEARAAALLKGFFSARRD